LPHHRYQDARDPQGHRRIVAKHSFALAIRSLSINNDVPSVSIHQGREVDDLLLLRFLGFYTLDNGFQCDINHDPALAVERDMPEPIDGDQYEASTWRRCDQGQDRAFNSTRNNLECVSVRKFP
jgi:hypothetical protein